MNRRSKIAAFALTTGLAVVGIVSPAQAAVTNATFTITGGSIAISVPGTTVALATVGTGATTAAGQLGPVTVADTRGALVNTWSTAVSTSAFVTGSSTPDETVAEPMVAYVSGASTAHSGLGAFVPGTKALPPSYVGLAGNSSTTWNPTLTFTLASSQVAGVYTGTVTQSLA